MALLGFIMKKIRNTSFIEFDPISELEGILKSLRELDWIFRV